MFFLFKEKFQKIFVKFVLSRDVKFTCVKNSLLKTYLQKISKHQ